jgi:hypothetical protein
MAKAENNPKPKKRAKKSAQLVDVTEGLSPMNLDAATSRTNLVQE